VHNKEATNDIVSESFIKLWQELKKKSDQEHNIKPFLFTILKNNSLDYLRKQILKQKHLKEYSLIHTKDLELRINSLNASHFDGLLIKEIQAIVHQSLSKMKPKTRKVFQLSRFNYLTNKEIANKLGLSEKGVEYHMSIAIKQLKIALKDYLPLLPILLTYLN